MIGKESQEGGLKGPQKARRRLIRAGQNQIKSLGLEGILSLLDQLVASATNFLTGVIVGRACTKGDFGLYLLCFNILLLVIDLQNSLLAAPYTVMSQRSSGRQLCVYTGNSIVQQLFLGLVVAIMLKLAAIFIAPISPAFSGLPPVMDALALAIAFIMLKEFIRRVCFAHLFMIRAFWLDLSVAAIQLLILTFMFIRGTISPKVVFWVMGFACLSGVGGWLILNRHIYSFSIKDFLGHFKKNWSFGSWLFGSSILWAVSMTLYPWILAYYHGPEATGVWGACWGVVSLANPLMLGVQNFLGPRIVRAYAEFGISGLKFRVKWDSVLFFMLVLPFVALFLSVGGELTVMFYGQKYFGYSKVVQILALNL
ncbi:MAG: oligosaccharide flippase family protein, partial [Thermodesulfobacteria bacterium]|nr:oligosaccharide flippase family protein [Thermodesulfobacteriota bacterium]